VLTPSSAAPRRDDEESAQAPYQLFLKPALSDLLTGPRIVSFTVPVTVTSPKSVCSAPTLPSHLSSTVDSVWPARTLVPVWLTLSLAERSISSVRFSCELEPARDTGAGSVRR